MEIAIQGNLGKIHMQTFHLVFTTIRWFLNVFCSPIHIDRRVFSTFSNKVGEDVLPGLNALQIYTLLYLRSLK